MIAGLVLLTTGASLNLTSCTAWNSMNKTGQGATAGGTLGAAVGTGVGALIGGGKGTWIGALVGSAIGAGTGALVGNSMDRQQKALQEQLDAMAAKEKSDSALIVQKVKDSNDLTALKLVMGNSVLFNTNSYTLSPAADATLSHIAYNLQQYPETDITVVGYTDNTGTQAINDRLSLERAQSVVNYLESQGIAPSRLKAIGDGWNDPIASNATPAGRAQNRRVEIYITASKQMIQQAESQASR